MTQPGKRRRVGVVDPPDLEGLCPPQKSVKKRRVGIIKPPVFEELRSPSESPSENHNSEAADDADAAAAADNRICGQDDEVEAVAVDIERPDTLHENTKDQATE